MLMVSSLGFALRCAQIRPLACSVHLLSSVTDVIENSRHTLDGPQALDLYGRNEIMTSLELCSVITRAAPISTSRKVYPVIVFSPEFSEIH